MLNKEFDTWQADYTAKINRWVPYYKDLLVQLIPAGKAAKDILDLGSGNGNVVAQLMNQFPEASYSLVDASEEMLAATEFRFRNRPGVQQFQKYFQDLSFPSASFDLVTACLAFHHLKGEEKKAIFKEIIHWLRPGGVLMISDLFATKKDVNYPQEILQPWEQYAKSKGTPDEEWRSLMEHHQDYDFPDTLEDHVSWLRSAGFERVDVFPSNQANWGTIQAQKGISQATV